MEWGGSAIDFKKCKAAKCKGEIISRIRLNNEGEEGRRVEWDRQ